MSGYNPVSVTILGATGSIGQSTLDVIGRHPERFSVFALTAHQKIDRLAELCIRFRPVYAVVATAAQADVLRTQLQTAAVTTEVLFGEQALCCLLYTSPSPRD